MRTHSSACSIKCLIVFQTYTQILSSFAALITKKWQNLSNILALYWMKLTLFWTNPDLIFTSFSLQMSVFWNINKNKRAWFRKIVHQTLHKLHKFAIWSAPPITALVIVNFSFSFFVFFKFIIFTIYNLKFNWTHFQHLELSEHKFLQSFLLSYCCFFSRFCNFCLFVGWFVDRGCF